MRHSSVRMRPRTCACDTNIADHGRPFAPRQFRFALGLKQFSIAFVESLERHGAVDLGKAHGLRIARVDLCAQLFDGHPDVDNLVARPDQGMGGGGEFHLRRHLLPVHLEDLGLPAIVRDRGFRRAYLSP